MPVDWLPLVLGVAFVGTVIVTAVVASSVKRPRKAWMVGLLAATIWPAFYVWFYYRAEIRYRRAADTGDVEAMYRLGHSYMSYNRGSPYDPPQGRELLGLAAE
jgi:ABC-type phosphate/phosphonate transport system permease subunit